MKKSTYILVLVAALGYFVDAYDLILFVVVRNSSLTELGMRGSQLKDVGLLLFNIQMLGMLIGGILFGVLGDKKGRISVLFGSIILYSLANIANGLVDNLWFYGLCRFFAGIGLAGELGAGITIVSETMPINKRGYGTMIVAAIGALGAVTAALVGDVAYWRTAYFIGGGIGLLLLLLRVGTFESAMFQKIAGNSVSKGDFLSLFRDKTKFKRYMACMLMGVPIFFMVTILMQLAPEVAKALDIQGKVTAGQAVLYVYGGLIFGDIANSLLSQFLKSRKKSIFIFQGLSFVMCIIYLNLWGASNTLLFIVCLIMGFASGYWVTLLTLSAEQFGTNLRATVATTIPNFARGAALPISILHQGLSKYFEGDIIKAAIILCVICFSGAFIANRSLKESFSKDLDFVE